MQKAKELVLSKAGSGLAGLALLLASQQRFFLPRIVEKLFQNSCNKLLLYIYPLIRTRLRYFPRLNKFVQNLCVRLLAFVDPCIQITFREFSRASYRRSQAYVRIEAYLSSIATKQAKKLNAEVVNLENLTVVLTPDKDEEITDIFDGIPLTWLSQKKEKNNDRRYHLAFDRKYRELITGSYLKHVLEQGKEIISKTRQRRLHTNDLDGVSGMKLWRHVAFEHPATFETLAMDPGLKESIMKDLTAFSNAKEHYARTGKAWKRGYLLYGPPGTGKSSLVAAMANFLNYDIFDLELTTVRDNSDLRRLLVDVPSKSIVSIEDIDCSLDLTGKRETEEVVKDKKAGDTKTRRTVTLSGLLNVIDGIWSACRGERIIVFTTNHVDKLDPALIRRGRMDKHIVLSYCKFEAFKILARNYLCIDSHPLFEKIGQLLEEVSVTPADVVEYLTPAMDGGDADNCLGSLILSLEAVKEHAKPNALKASNERRKRKQPMKTNNPRARTQVGIALDRIRIYYVIKKLFYFFRRDVD